MWVVLSVPETAEQPRASVSLLGGLEAGFKHQPATDDMDF